MTLIDTEANAVSTEFEQQGPHGSIACFLPFMPGMFATVSVRSAIIALWNVSNRAPMELISKHGTAQRLRLATLSHTHSLRSSPKTRNAKQGSPSFASFSVA
jgi:hypothetical protein